MTIYIMASNGQILTDRSIEKILKSIAKASGLKRVDYVYRCGPIVNEPVTFINEISSLNINEYELVFIDSTRRVLVLDDESKQEFVNMLRESQIPGMTTGMLLEEYLKK